MLVKSFLSITVGFNSHFPSPFHAPDPLLSTEPALCLMHGMGSSTIIYYG